MIVVNDSSTGNVKNKIRSVLYQFDRSEVEFDSTLFSGHFGWNTDENSIFGSSAMIVRKIKRKDGNSILVSFGIYKDIRFLSSPATSCFPCRIKNVRCSIRITRNMSIHIFKKQFCLLYGMFIKIIRHGLDRLFADKNLHVGVSLE